METKAAIYVRHGEPLEIGTLELPHPRPDQVIVHLIASGICHSQLHQIHDPKTPTPTVLGHEATGIVTH